MNVTIKSTTASKEQISQLYEIGKKLSLAFVTLTNGLFVNVVNSSSIMHRDNFSLFIDLRILLLMFYKYWNNDCAGWVIVL